MRSREASPWDAAEVEEAVGSPKGALVAPPVKRVEPEGAEVYFIGTPPVSADLRPFLQGVVNGGTGANRRLGAMWSQAATRSGHLRSGCRAQGMPCLRNRGRKQAVESRRLKSLCPERHLAAMAWVVGPTSAYRTSNYFRSFAGASWLSAQGFHAASLDLCRPQSTSPRY